MRLQLVLRSLLLLLMVSGCTSREIEAAIDETARNDFAKLPGGILITVQSEGRTLRRAIRAGSVEPASQITHGSRESHASVLPYGATMLPDRRGEYYRGPYVLTGDEKYMAASFVTSVNENMPRSLAIIEWANKREVAAIRGTKEEVVYALAWSPDSRLLAVLKKSYQRGPFSLGNLISAISGHPVRSETYSLEIYELSGVLRVRSNLVVDVPQSTANLAWVP